MIGFEDDTFDDDFDDGRMNPFPGLRSFEPDEDHLFFGREKQIDELLARLQRTRFLAIVGTSGSGKSSLIRSGMIPSLYSGYMVGAGSNWRVALFRPGDDPIGNLAESLNTPEVLGVDEDVIDMNRSMLEVTLHRSANGLVDAVRQARVPKHENILVVVDQFEEIFRFKRSLTAKKSRDEAISFVRLLLAAADQDEIPVYIVITMRSDFIGNCTEFEGLAEELNDGQFLVPRMTRDERRTAIVGPVAVGGAEISPRLVLRLLNDVGDDPDQLPIMQHSMMRTWDYWEDHHGEDEAIDLRHYEAIGTMHEALSQHAEEAYRELDAKQGVLAERMFKLLTDSRGVRSPRQLSEICEVTESEPEEVIEVIEHFRQPGRSFLMPPSTVEISGSTVIDISHESLMRAWTRLKAWVEEEAQSVQIYLRLSRASALHQEGKVGLWRDPELQLALNWKEETRPTRTWAERYDPAFERAMVFLDASRRNRDQELARREELQARRLRRARLIAILVGSLGFVAAVVAVIAIQKTAEAQQERQAALVAQSEAEHQRGLADEQRVIATEQKEVAEEQREVAVVAEAAAVDARFEAEEQREVAVEQRSLAVSNEKEANVQREKAVESQQVAEEQREVAVTQRGIAEVAQTEAEASEKRAQRLRRLAIARRVAVESTRLLDAGAPELPALLAREAYEVNLRDEGPPHNPALDRALRGSLEELRGARRFTDFHDGVRAVILSENGKRAIAAGDDGTIRIWDPTPGAESLATTLEVGNPVRSMALAPQGQELVVGTMDGRVLVFDLGAPASAPRLLREHAGIVGAVVFDSAGGILASGGADGMVYVGPVDGAHTESRSFGVAVRALAVDPSGKKLAVGGDVGGIEIWNLANPDESAVGISWPIPVRSLAISPDGAFLAAGDADGGLHVWNLENPGDEGKDLTGHVAGVTGLRFHPDGELLASSSLDRTVRLWNVQVDSPEPLELVGHRSWVWGVGFSEDGSTLASASADRSVRLWTTKTDDLAGEICRRVKRNLDQEEWSQYLAELPYEDTCPDAGSDGVAQ